MDSAQFRVDHRFGRISFMGLLAAWSLLGACGAVFADNGVGAWLSPTNTTFWGLIPIHATLTPDGRVLTYGVRSAGSLIYDVWDPALGLMGGHITLPNQTQTNIFCSAQVVLPQDGEIFLAGGKLQSSDPNLVAGTAYTNLFNYSDNSLTRGNDLNRPRYYATTTTLVNGEVYIQGGLNGEDFPEVRDTSGNFRLLTGAPTNGYWWDYPRDFVAPDGRVFGYDNQGHMFYVSTGGPGSIAAAGKLSPTYTALTASAVMFQPGKILQFGGKWKGALVIDLTAMNPKWKATGNMSSVRQWVNATVLPDGRVLATGGSAAANQLTGVNNTAEIWNPNTGTWTVGTSGATPRLYHSTALLLPDASVLVGGGGSPGPLTNKNAEIYYPPYLYTSSGALAPRPSIVSAPDALDIGQSFTMDVGTAAISRVTLVKTGAVTHSFNMDQRFLELPFTTSSGTLNVGAPTRASDAPPGYYLLFAIDTQGVPSVAKIVKINVQTDNSPPSQPTGLALSMPNGKPSLSWTPSTDDIGVAGYIIHRSTDGTLGAEVARTLGATWIDPSPTPGTTYTYAVEAYDVAGNVSVATSPASITVYRAPANLTVILTSGKPQLTWDASTDFVGVANYAIYRSTKGVLGGKVASTTATTWKDPSVKPGVTYTYGIKAYDSAGYTSGPSALVSITAP
jgi:galactose oxidase-like protein